MARLRIPAADPLCDGIDQRGHPRRVAGAHFCDIGAYQSDHDGPVG